MARKNVVKQDIKITGDPTKILSEAFDKLLESKYGHLKAPPPIITQTGIRHLDAFLGGGLASSNPIIISSTPETGKSTFAFQFSRIFQKTHKNSIILYLDIEGTANLNSQSSFQKTRIEQFNLDTATFKYQPLKLRVCQTFELFSNIIEVKKRLKESSGEDFNVLIIWDSLASTAVSKIDSVDDVNKIVGLKAREIGFYLEKIAPELAFERITLLMIDQVRANLQLDSLYQAKEKSVGVFKDYKAATSILSLNHKTGQWLFLSKKQSITPADGLDINGWYLDIYSEKNKFAPSQFTIRVVFDKISGIDKFWSEYVFLSELTPSEQKFYKNKSVPFDLPIKKSGSFVFLEYIDPNTGEVEYKSKNFYRKDAKKKYETDEEFRFYFDKAMEASIKRRIIEGLFSFNKDFNELVKDEPTTKSTEEVLNEPVIDEEFEATEPVYEPVFDEKLQNLQEEEKT